MTRTVLFTGSRDYNDLEMVAGVVAGVAWRAKTTATGLIVVHGDARGADTLVHRSVEGLIAAGCDIVEARCPAEWTRCAPDCPPTTGHRRTRSVPGPDGLVDESYCPAAGVRRNQEMLDQHRPDLVLAFVSKPLHLSRGTDDMVRRALAAHIPTHVISPGGTR